jgi:hypothetical protein
MAMNRCPGFSPFKGVVEPFSVRQGTPQIGEGLRPPLLGTSRVRDGKVSDRKTRAKHCSIASIEQVQLIGDVLVQSAHDRAADLAADVRAEMPAFKVEVGQFLDRIDHPKLGVELQAVDNPDLLAEPNVLRTQIAMPVHDPPPPQTVKQNFIMSEEKGVQHSVDVADWARWKLELRLQQYSQVLLQARFPSP